MNIFRKRSVLAIIIVVANVFGNIAFGQNQLVGFVSYAGNEEWPLADVNAHLYDLNDSLISSSVTNTAGYYQFNNIPNGEFLIKYDTESDVGEVGIEDAYTLMSYLSGNTEFTEFQLAIADVDDNDIINWKDFKFVLVNYLLRNEPFPAGEWQFEEHLVNFSSREAGDTIKDSGGKTGKNNPPEGSGRDISIINSNYVAIQLKDKLQFTVESDYEGTIGGFNLQLEYPANMISISAIEGIDENIQFNLDEENGFIDIVWVNEGVENNFYSKKGLVTLTLEPVEKNIIYEGMIELLPGSSLLDIQGEKLEDVSINLPMLKQSKDNDFAFSTYPNPVSNSMNINISVPISDYAELLIYNVQGVIVEKHENMSLKTGEQSFAVNTQNYKPGHYFYVIKFANGLLEPIQGRFYRSPK